MYLPGVPVHVVQRGHNRDACSFAEDDFRYYCLMTNHVHLLITPEYADSISRVSTICGLITSPAENYSAGLLEGLVER